MVVPTIPVAGMAVILGIDRFLSMFRAIVNMIGNAVATIVVARWEREIDGETVKRNLAIHLTPTSVVEPVTEVSVE
jgi:aerobic C4-dicarboxylate transport protein